MSVSEIIVKYHFSFKRPNFNKLKLGKLTPYWYRSYQLINHVLGVSDFDILSGTIKNLKKIVKKNAI